MELKRNCAQCKKEFTKNPYVSMADWEGYGKRGTPVRFCSRRCAWDSRKGGVAHNKGVSGKKWTKERRDDVSSAGRERRKKWAGNKVGVMSGGSWQYLRLDTFLRDNYTCQDCGLREPEIMCVDHIKPKSIYPELMYDINNCLTLCPNCHARKTVRDRKEIRQYKKTVVANA